MDIVILFFISSVLLVYTLVPAFLAKRPLTLEVSVQERQRNALKQEKSVTSGLSRILILNWRPERSARMIMRN